MIILFFFFAIIGPLCELDKMTASNVGKGRIIDGSAMRSGVLYHATWLLFHVGTKRSLQCTENALENV